MLYLALLSDREKKSLRPILKKKPSFQHFHLLTPPEQELLSRVSEWEWISSIGPQTTPPLQHRKHAEYMKKPGNLYAPAHREVMLTFRGTAVHSLNDKVYARRPGTVMLFDYHESRDLKGATHKKAFHCLWFHFYSRECFTYNSNSCDAKGRYFQEIPTGVRSGSRVRLVMDAWDRSIEEPHNLLCRELLKAHLTALLLEILGDPDRLPQESQQQQVIDSIRVYITNHLGDDLSLHCLAQVAGYSPFFLHRLFVRYVGKTPVEYVNELRLERAKELLRKNYTVQATSEGIGFASASYFTQFFRKRMGLSPKAWHDLDA